MTVVGEQDAARALSAGAVVAVPTDTVYGLAADPSRPGATALLFALKDRPGDVALPVLVADGAQARHLVDPEGWTPALDRLVQEFWPGALTVVARRRAGLVWDLGGDAGTIGLRCPAADVVRRLCRVVGPLAATSANPHGQAPLTTAQDVVACFGADQPVLDGGTCGEPPSTVVDLTGDTPRCLRAGAIGWDEILRVSLR